MVALWFAPIYGRANHEMLPEMTSLYPAVEQGVYLASFIDILLNMHKLYLKMLPSCLCDDLERNRNCCQKI